MKTTFFKAALATLTTCGLVGIAISTAKAQTEGPFGTLVPIGQVGGRVPRGMFSPSGSQMFGARVSQFNSAETQPQFGTTPFGTAPGNLQNGGINAAYATPGAYGFYDGNNFGPGYGNFGGGYLNNELGYSGYSPYYGNYAGYGVNYGGVNSDPYGNYTAPSSYGSSYYGNSSYGNGYYPPTYSATSGAYRGYTGNSGSYGPGNGNMGYVNPVTPGALGWF